KIPMTANFLRADARRIIITSDKENMRKIKSLQDAGVEMIFLTGDYYPMRSIFETLSGAEIGSVMVEGGGILFSQILSKKIYDELCLFVAPQTVGAGIDFISENNIELNNMKAYDIGEDKLYVYRNS
ncbi:MAG: dihydrofolate reductase family protein, partial [candidate division WOR-3 bacterium]